MAHTYLEHFESIERIEHMIAVENAATPLCARLTAAAPRLLRRCDVPSSRLNTTIIKCSRIDHLSGIGRSDQHSQGQGKPRQRAASTGPKSTLAAPGRRRTRSGMP